MYKRQAYTIVGPDHLPYKTVLAEDGKEWLDRNLGATQVANAYNDTAAYGHLYQWGRYTDGHQIRNSGTTTTLSSSDSPGHGNFIINPGGNNDWRTPQQTLWLGVSGTNNPCPSGFRIPTQAELANLFNLIPNFTTATCGATSSCKDVAAGSLLRLPSGGFRDYSSAGLSSLGSSGYYWSSTVGGVNAYDPYFGSSAVGPAYDNYRAYGFSVRCLKD